MKFSCELPESRALFLSLFYILVQLWQAWPQLRGLEIEPVPALLALFFGTLGYFYYALLWRKTLQRMEVKLALFPALYIWFVSQLARYTPGKVWHLVGRTYLAR